MTCGIERVLEDPENHIFAYHSPNCHGMMLTNCAFKIYFFVKLELIDCILKILEDPESLFTVAKWSSYGFKYNLESTLLLS